MNTFKSIKPLNGVQNELETFIKSAYNSAGLAINNFKINRESKEYSACSFEINHHKIVFRIAKITPKKVGQFVAIWKRNQNGITEPYDHSDNFDFIIIATKKDENAGQFIFSKSVLTQKGILTKNGKEGKRGIRVYPPWDIPTNKQALGTQKWQTNYFFSIEEMIKSI